MTRDIVAESGCIIEVLGDFDPYDGPFESTAFVDIDLNGFTLESGGTCGIRAQDLRRVIVRNGTIRVAGGTGVSVSFGDATIEDLRVTGGGILLGAVNEVIVRRNVVAAASSTHDAISLGFTLNFLPRDRIQDNVILRGSIEAAGSVGFEYTSLEVVGNKVEQGNIGVNGLSLAVRDNVVRRAGFAPAITVAYSLPCLIDGNVLSDGNSHGLLIGPDATGCLVLNNATSAFSGDGVRVEGDFNQISENLVTQNGAWGLNIAGDSSTFGQNTVRGNSGTPGVCPAQACSDLKDSDFCDTGSGNFSFGDNLAPGPGPC